MLLVCTIRIFSNVARHVSSPEVGRQIPAGMRAADLDRREAVQCSIEDHAGEEKRCLERIADNVAQVAASAKRAFFNNVVRAARMDEYQDAKLLNFVPERIVLRRGRNLTPRVPGDPHSAQPQLFHGLIQLLCGHIRVLQRDRSQTDESVGMSIAPGGKPLVLNLDNLPREIAVRLIPPAALMAENLDINPELIQYVYPARAENQRAVETVADVPGQVRAFYDVEFLGSNEVSMNVDNLHPTFPNQHFATLGWSGLK